MPRPDVRECREAVEVLAPGGDVEQRQLVDHRVRDAHVDAAERVHDPLKPTSDTYMTWWTCIPVRFLTRPRDELRSAAVDAVLERGVDPALADAGDVDPQVAREGQEDRLSSGPGACAPG